MALFVKYLQDPPVHHLTRVFQISDSPFIVDHSRPNFALGTLNPAIQKQNDSCFVFTSDMFILICRYTVKYNEQKINTATKTNTLYIPHLLNHLLRRFAHHVPGTAFHSHCAPNQNTSLCLRIPWATKSTAWNICFVTPQGTKSKHR